MLLLNLYQVFFILRDFYLVGLKCSVGILKSRLRVIGTEKWNRVLTDLVGYRDNTNSHNLNPPTDRPFETIQNFPFQKCPLVLYTHGDTI